MYLAAAPSSASSLNESACLDPPQPAWTPPPLPDHSSLPFPPAQGPAAGAMGATRAPDVGEAPE